MPLRAASALEIMKITYCNSCPATLPWSFTIKYHFSLEKIRHLYIYVYKFFSTSVLVQSSSLTRCFILFLTCTKSLSSFTNVTHDVYIVYHCATMLMIWPSTFRKMKTLIPLYTHTHIITLLLLTCISNIHFM